MTTRQKNIILISCISICAVIAGITIWSMRTVPDKMALVKPVPPVEKRISVQSKIITPASAAEYYETSGRTYAGKWTQITSYNGGQVETLLVRKGDFVHAGDTVAIVNRNLGIISLNRLLGRQERLMKSLGPETCLQDKNYRKLMKKIDKSRYALTRAEVVAPVTGYISRTLVERDEFISPGQALFKVNAIDSVRVVFDLPERDRSYYRSRQTRVRVTFDRFPAQTFTSKITYIRPQKKKRGTVFKAETRLANSRLRFRPGWKAAVQVDKYRVDDGILIDPEYIYSSGTVSYVWLVKNGSLQQRNIIPGLQVDDKVHILSGLAAGDRLVISSPAGFRGGLPVDIVYPGDEPANNIVREE